MDKKLKGYDKKVKKNNLFKLIELIESEIISNSPDVKWADIAGLEFAKKTIIEIIIWPMLRPDIFSGIRRPPKVNKHFSYKKIKLRGFYSSVLQVLVKQ